jgi:hypothetical protein
MTREEAELFLRDVESESLFADGFDDCIIGIGRSFDTYKVVYDTGKVLDKLCESGMTEDEGGTLGKQLDEYIKRLLALLG